MGMKLSSEQPKRFSQCDYEESKKKKCGRQKGDHRKMTEHVLEVQNLYGLKSYKIL